MLQGCILDGLVWWARRERERHHSGIGIRLQVFGARGEGVQAIQLPPLGRGDGLLSGEELHIRQPVESGKTGWGVSILPSRLYSRLTGWWSEPMLSGGLWSRSEEFGAWLLRLRECGGKGGLWIS